MALDMKFFEEMEARIPKGKVRTRFAPSPTGYMHVGNLRTALYTWLIARHAQGTFILRIEDTDQGRLVEGATDVIYRTMAECGLTHDEGPDVGGPVGPYIQSQRRISTCPTPSSWWKRAPPTTASVKRTPLRTRAGTSSTPTIPAATSAPRRSPRIWRPGSPMSSASASLTRGPLPSTMCPSAISPWKTALWMTRCC